MGTCLSKNGLKPKKKTPSSSSSPASPCQNPTSDLKPSKNPCSFKISSEENRETVKQTVVETPNPTIVNQKEGEEEQKCEMGSNADEEKAKPNKRNGVKREQSNGFDDPCPAAVVKISSCTKEEVDAILIQCGRLSRSSSGKASNENNNPRSLSKKYSGSKRSYEFHDDEEEDENQQQQHEAPGRPTHRRTPSRDRDIECKRSGSRDRGIGEEIKRGSGRRISRSPGRRSETPAEKSRPGKIVSGSCSVSKNNSCAAIEAGLSIKRATATANSIKRTVNPVELGVRSSSPRSRSPATRAAVGTPTTLTENNILPSLSRNSSRKTDNSPFRRPPTTENDENSIRTEQPNPKAHEQQNNSKMQRNKENEERMKRHPLHSESQKTKESGAQTQKNDERSIRTMETRVNSNNDSRITRKQLLCCREKDQLVAEKTETHLPLHEEIARSVNPVEIETPHLPQTMTRTRSSRRSREQFFPDLDLDETQHNHHQQTALSLPPCVSKACSILEAVADLNSCINSTLSANDKTPETEDRDRSKGQQLNQGSRKMAMKDCDHSLPFLESEVLGHNDLTEPSFHKYVSVRNLGKESEQQESAGSNSFIHNQWISSWDGCEASADSTDRWTCSSSSAFLSNSLTSEEVEVEGGGGEQQGLGSDSVGRRLRHWSSNNLLPVITLSSKNRDFEQDVGVVRSFQIPVVAAAATSI